MDWEAALPWMVALGGGAGIAAGINALVTVVKAVKSGVSAREGKRKTDIIQQRDEAMLEGDRQRKRAAAFEARSDAAVIRADWAEQNMTVARHNEQRAREHAAELRLLLMEPRDRPFTRAELPSWPSMDETIPRAKLLEMIEQAQREGEESYE